MEFVKFKNTTPILVSVNLFVQKYNLGVWFVKLSNIVETRLRLSW